MNGNRKGYLIILFQFVLLFGILTSTTHIAQAAQPAAIHAVFFYSPTCPHCHDVMEKVLPPLVQQYPDQLDIVGIDVTHPVGSEIYQSMLTAFLVPDDRIGVPTLVVGSMVLVGTTEIEQNLPSLIKIGLTTGGINWPPIPGLDKVLQAQGKQTAVGIQPPSQAAKETTWQNSGIFDSFRRDPLTNSIAVLTLLGMIIAGAAVALSYFRGPDNRFVKAPEWAIPLFSILGLGVALYLSFVEVTGTTAICGPVGDCNSVQQSVYAKLFGIIPVGLLGAAGYIGILATWMLRRFGPKSIGKAASVAIWGMAWFGVLFSIYLTYLEPFVIGTACAWCIASAILITLILLASTHEAKEALRIVDLEDEEEIEIGSETAKFVPSQSRK